MSFSLDVNILLYASDSSSPYHPRARDFLDSCRQGSDLFCLAWPTVMSYLRISTHPSIFNYPLTSLEARSNIEALLNLPQVRLLAEEDGFWKIYCEITEQVPTRGNLVPDAHVAAILRQHGIKTLYTHDRDFLKFTFLDVQDPLGDQ